jgi:hypothetical protein
MVFLASSMQHMLAVDDADNIVATFLQPGKVPSIRHRDTTF